MVSSAASKVTHRHEDEAEIDQFDDEYYDEVEAEGHTIAMSPIDVEQFNEEETFSASEEGISSQVSLQETTVSPALFDEDAVYAEENVDTTEAEIDYETAPVSPIMGMEGMGTASTSVAQESNDASQSDRHVIVLPDVVAPVGGSIESAKQRAPMAVDDERLCRSLRCFLTCYRASAQINLSVRQRRKRANNVRSSKPLVWNCLISTRAISSALRCHRSTR